MTVLGTSFVVALTVLAVATANQALAQGFYVQGGAAYTSPQGADAKGPAATFGTTKLEYDAGYRLNFAGGYNFNPIRAELEIYYSRSNVDTMRNAFVGGGATLKASGATSTTALMANGYYDFVTGTPFSPYLGAGIGWAKVDVNSVTAPGYTTTDDGDNVFAFQGMVGVAYEVTKQLALTAEYRYFGAQDVSLRDRTGTAYKTDGQRVHSFGAGLRYAF